jgi:hypothetical protein
VKPATERKVKEVQGRAKSLKSSFIREIEAEKNPQADADDKLVPRVSGIVLREGKFCCKTARRFLEKYEGLKLDGERKKALEAAEKFFEQYAEIHEEEVKKNDFIFRLPARFITHLEFASALVLAFDAEVKAMVAKIELDDAGDDAEVQEEIDAEMTL